MDFHSNRIVEWFCDADSSGDTCLALEGHVVFDAWVDEKIVKCIENQRIVAIGVECDIRTLLVGTFIPDFWRPLDIVILSMFH